MISRFKFISPIVTSAFLVGCGSAVSSPPTTPASLRPPAGWAQTEIGGVFISVCKLYADNVNGSRDPACSAAESRAGAPALVMKVFCRDIPCKDIYVEANRTTDEGQVLGIANDSGYGRKGDIVYLALGGYRDDNLFAFPEVTKMVIDGRSLIGFPLGLGSPQE